MAAACDVVTVGDISSLRGHFVEFAVPGHDQVMRATGLIPATDRSRRHRAKRALAVA